MTDSITFKIGDKQLVLRSDWSLRIRPNFFQFPPNCEILGFSLGKKPYFLYRHQDKLWVQRTPDLFDELQSLSKSVEIKHETKNFIIYKAEFEAGKEAYGTMEDGETVFYQQKKSSKTIRRFTSYPTRFQVEQKYKFREVRHRIVLISRIEICAENSDSDSSCRSESEEEELDPGLSTPP